MMSTSNVRVGIVFYFKTVKVFAVSWTLPRHHVERYRVSEIHVIRGVVEAQVEVTLHVKAWTCKHVIIFEIYKDLCKYICVYVCVCSNQR